MMRKWVYLILLGITGCAQTLPQEFTQKKRHRIAFEGLHTQYRAEDSFKGIVEAFQKVESTGGRLFLRSDPNRREGLYFIVYLNTALRRIPAGSKVVVHVVTDKDPHEKIHTWEIPTLRNGFERSRNEIYLGITDDGIYNSDTKVVSWKVDLLDPEGQLINSLQSFAWEMHS